MRSLEGVDVREPAPEEDSRCDDEHRHVDQAGDHHGDEDVDARVPVERLRLFVVPGDDSVLGEGRVKWLGKSFEAPIYAGVRATWWKSDTWGFGVEVNHAKVYSENKAALGYDTLEFTDGLNLITANVFRRFPNAGRFTPYVGGGLGIAVPHVEIARAGEAKTFEYQLTGPAAILVFGTSYEINDKWSLFAEYKGSYSMNKAKVDTGGTLSTNIVTNAINLGISYSF